MNRRHFLRVGLPVVGAIAGILLAGAVGSVVRPQRRSVQLSTPEGGTVEASIDPTAIAASMARRTPFPRPVSPDPAVEPEAFWRAFDAEAAGAGALADAIRRAGDSDWWRYGLFGGTGRAPLPGILAQKARLIAFAHDPSLPTSFRWCLADWMLQYLMPHHPFSGLSEPQLTGSEILALEGALYNLESAANPDWGLRRLLEVIVRSFAGSAEADIEQALAAAGWRLEPEDVPYLCRQVVPRCQVERAP